MSTKPTRPAPTATAPPPPSPDDAAGYLLEKGWRCLGSPRSLHARWLEPNATRVGTYQHKVKRLMNGEQEKIDENEQARRENPHIPEYVPQYTHQTVYTPPTTPLPLDQAVEQQYYRDWEQSELEQATNQQ